VADTARQEVTLTLEREEADALMECWGFHPEVVDAAEQALAKLRKALDAPQVEAKTEYRVIGEGRGGQRAVIAEYVSLPVARATARGSASFRNARVQARKAASDWTDLPEEDQDA
jgi:hypothetical protein